MFFLLSLETMPPIIVRFVAGTSSRYLNNCSPSRTGAIKCSRMEIISTGKALGAVIRGVDLRKMVTAEFELVHRLWLEHQVVVFQEQQLNDEDLIHFSRRFGELDIA